MRAALLLLTLALAATPALAQQKITEKPSVSTARLRGTIAPKAETAAAAAAPASLATAEPLTALPPLISPLAAPVAGDAGRCRLSCASSYYFCLATDAPEDCAPSWGQCRSRCDAPSPVQVISTIPSS